MGLSVDTGKHCVFGHLGLVFVWSCFVFCLLFLLLCVISAPVLAEAARVVVARCVKFLFCGCLIWRLRGLFFNPNLWIALVKAIYQK